MRSQTLGPAPVDTPAMVRRWHADPFGFLRPWNEVPALIGSAPPATPPLDRHGCGHLPDGVASDGAPNDGLRGAVRPDFRAGNELMGESGPRLRNRSGVPNLSRNN
jgi:hypothetical protein